MKPSLSVWTEVRWSAGGAEAYVLSAQAPGKKGRGVRLTSRNNEQEILDLKRQLENSDLTDINDMKLHVAKRRAIARPLLKDCTSRNSLWRYFLPMVFSKECVFQISRFELSYTGL